MCILCTSLRNHPQNYWRFSTECMERLLLRLVFPNFEDVHLDISSTLFWRWFFKLFMVKTFDIKMLTFLLFPVCCSLVCAVCIKSGMFDFNFMYFIFYNCRNADTLIHLLKGSLGTGILAMPKAFSRSGYVVGFVSTIVIGIICTYCIHMLLRSHYELCKRKRVIV